MVGPEHATADFPPKKGQSERTKAGRLAFLDSLETSSVATLKKAL